MISVAEVRKKILEWKRYKEARTLKNAPVIHKGFPSSFNLSFGEYEMLEEFKGQYLHFDHDFVYSKIQPCIRHQDWNTIVNDLKNCYRYLSLFDMADISGLIIKKDLTKEDEAAKFAIKSFINFIKSLDLKVENLRISYFAGGTIAEATKGKYKIDKFIDPDPLKDYWISLGVKEEQFVPDKTRDTFLSLRIFGLPTPWGYRNEINYIYRGEMLDIGTVEYMKFQPVFFNFEIVDVEDFEHTLAISAVGVERLTMIVNNLENIWNVDTIQPLIDEIMKISNNKNEHHAMVLVQSLRAIHRIVSDGGEYKNLNSRRKEYARMFYREFFDCLDKLKVQLSDSVLFNLLKSNTQLQPYYPELGGSIQKTINEINLRKEAFKSDKSIKRGVAQK